MIDRARKLIGLDADEPDQRPAAVARDRADDAVGAHPAVGLVIGVEAQLDVVAEDLALARASSASPLSAASVLEGIADRNHWIG